MIEHTGDRNGLVFRLQRRNILYMPENISKIAGTHAEMHFSAFDLGDIKNIVDQRKQKMAGGADLIQRIRSRQGRLKRCASSSNAPTERTVAGMLFTRQCYSKLPYIVTASSTVISPFPTRNAAILICVVRASEMPSISGDRVRFDGTCPKGA